jgi:hypothetical protein
MSEESYPQDDQQARDLRGEVADDASWESPADHAREPSAPGSERVTIELPAKRRRSPRRAATPAQGGDLDGSAVWLSVAIAVLAACLGAAIALALAGPATRPEPARQYAAVRRCAPSRRSDTVRERVRPPKRRTRSASTHGAAIPPGSHSRAATAPKPPPASARTAGQPAPESPPEAPAAQTVTEGQRQGGPFSP